MNEKKTKRVNKLNIVISLLIAIVAWFTVIYNFVPMKEVKYYNIPVKYVGIDTLKYRGLEVKSKEKVKVDLLLNVKRTEITKIDKKDIEINADLSEAEYGNNKITLEIETPGGTMLIKSSVRSVSVRTGWIGTK